MASASIWPPKHRINASRLAYPKTLGNPLDSTTPECALNRRCSVQPALSTVSPVDSFRRTPSFRGVVCTAMAYPQRRHLLNDLIFYLRARQKCDAAETSLCLKQNATPAILPGRAGGGAGRRQVRAALYDNWHKFR